MRTERELLVDCLERLNRRSVPYMLVGAMASNYWGLPRTTHDLDFVLFLLPADVESLAAAFGEGFFIQVEKKRKRNNGRDISRRLSSTCRLQPAPCLPPRSRGAKCRQRSHQLASARP
jgi:hypothetical protein